MSPTLLMVLAALVAIAPEWAAALPLLLLLAGRPNRGAGTDDQTVTRRVER